jgi:ketosteroid isomerase-like protein
MSEENVQIWRQMYEAFGRGDTDAALGYFDPEVVVDASHRVDGRVGHGHAQLMSILGEWLGTWEDWAEDVEEIRSIGGGVLVVTSQRGRGKGSGIEWEGRFAMVYEIRGDKITRWTIYDDLEEGFKAAGLDP